MVKTMVLRDVHDPMVAVVATMMTTITDPAGKTEDVRSLMLIYVYIIDRQQVTAAEMILLPLYPHLLSLVER